MAISATTTVHASQMRLAVLVTEDGNAANTVQFNPIAAMVAALTPAQLANSPLYNVLNTAYAAQANAQAGIRNDVDLVIYRQANAAGGNSSSATPAITTETRSGFCTWINPIAEELVSIKADALCVNGPAVIVGQPDCPRCLAVRITIAVNAITAGVLRIVGPNASGSNTTEDVSLVTGVSVTRYTANAFAGAVTLTVVGLVGGAGAGDNLSVGVANRLGLVGTSVPLITAGSWNVYKTIVNQADEVVAGVDVNAGTVLPTTVPNAANVYAFCYTYGVQLTQAAHTHTGTSIPALIANPNISGVGAGNFRLDLTGVKGADANTGTYILEIIYRHSIVK